MKGSGKPVTGMICSVIPTFWKICQSNMVNTPAQMYVPSRSRDRCAIRQMRISATPSSTSMAAQPMRPNCSPTAAKGKSAYPRRDNLHDRIQRLGIYPVTVLQSLSMSQIKTLINNGVILCRDLIQNKSSLRHLRLSQKKLDRVVHEVENICNIKK